jgi:hypothetical protein
MVYNVSPTTLFQAGFGGGGGPAPNAVGVQLIENADLSSTSTQIEYRIEGIPPRAEAYYVSAFLDDDGNAEHRKKFGNIVQDLTLIQRQVAKQQEKLSASGATATGSTMTMPRRLRPPFRRQRQRLSRRSPSLHCCGSWSSWRRASRCAVTPRSICKLAPASR